MPDFTLFKFFVFLKNLIDRNIFNFPHCEPHTKLRALYFFVPNIWFEKKITFEAILSSFWRFSFCIQNYPLATLTPISDIFSGSILAFSFTKTNTIDMHVKYTPSVTNLCIIFKSKLFSLLELGQR